MTSSTLISTSKMSQISNNKLIAASQSQQRKADGVAESAPQTWKLMLLAGLANCPASTATQPLDVIKIRLQLDNELTHHTAKAKTYQGIVRGIVTLARQEGVLALYKGWTAGMMREMTYSSGRMGLYEPIKRQLGATDRHNTPLYLKAAAGALAAGTAASYSTPVDLVKVQMQSQVSGPGARHKGTIAAFRNIYRSSGIRGLYAGVTPNITRAVFASSSQVSSYDHVKHTLLNHGILTEGMPLHALSSLMAGFVSAAFSAPFDNIKTRVMNQIGDERGVRYSSPVDAMMKTFKSEGMKGVYKGFLPFWMRITPHTVISFIAFEELRQLAGIEPI